MRAILSIDPIRPPLTGIGRYTYELANNLLEIPELDLRFMSGTSILADLPQPGAIERPTRQTVKRLLLKSRVAVSLGHRVQSRRVNQALADERDSVFHGPNYYLPRFGGPAVATIHDLSMYKWSACHPPERVRFLRAQIELTLKRASMLITDSEYTKQEVASYFNWPVERIAAIPLAASSMFKPKPESAIQEPLSRLQLRPDSYCLFTGTIEPRKNVGLLLEAYSSLPSQIKQTFPLVICGANGWNNSDLLKRIRTHQREGWVKFLGHVSDESLSALMAGARVFAFPSHYEGFGLPVLEALSCGTPVVCSDAGSLAEVAGSCALRFDSRDTSAMSAALLRALEDSQWRSSARKLGTERASQFSWKRCAMQTLDVYKSAKSY